MAIFNIICAKKGREECFEVFINHLSNANWVNYHTVNIFVASADELLRKYCKRENINIFVLPFYLSTGFFNKSILLNYGLHHAISKKCDYLSIMDIDICYRRNFFDYISKTIHSNEIVVSGGIKANREISRIILRGNVEAGIVEQITPSNYPSQITMKPKTYKLLLDVLGSDKLYDERFVGWGGEDSSVSALIRALDKRGIVKRIYADNMWVHLWHDEGYKNSSDTERNMKLYQQLEIEYQKKAREYCIPQ